MFSAGHPTNCSSSQIPFLTVEKERIHTTTARESLGYMWRKRVLSGAAMNVPLSDALAKTEEKGMSSRMRWDCMIPIDF